MGREGKGLRVGVISRMPKQPHKSEDSVLETGDLQEMAFESTLKAIASSMLRETMNLKKLD